MDINRNKRIFSIITPIVWVIACLLVLSACAVPSQSSKPTVTSSADPADVSEIYLAGGCFWGVEKYIASIQGVLNTEAGYANGTTDSPTYGEVVTGLTGDAETVRVDYDPTVAPLPFILELLYKAIDPTSVNRQGNDVGTQYRSGIYYSDEADLPVIERSIAQLQERYDKPIAIEVAPLTSFTTAEEYHQDYLEKNPQGYCHIGGDLFRSAAEAKPEESHFTTPPAE